MSTAAWTPPETWQVPREWPGERCFILCGGESLRAQRKLIPRLKGRFIAVKEGVLFKPDADVLFIAGDGNDIDIPLFKFFTGTHIVVRRKMHPSFPPETKCVTRTKDHEHLCELRDHVCGYDSGTSCINLAYHFGATEIVLLGYDMTGGRSLSEQDRAKFGLPPHPMPQIPEAHFRRHLGPLAALNEDAKAKGIRIVNCSPTSRVKAFERQPLEAFL